MNWSNHSTPKTMTMKAQGEEGRAYEVVSTGIMNPVRAYSVERGTTKRRHKKTLIARVPTINIALISAEEVERQERNGDIRHEDPAVVKRAQETRDALKTEPRFTYTFSTPVSQMTTVQKTLDQAIFDIRLNCNLYQEAATLKAAIIHLAELWKAIGAVNEELDIRGLQPKLPGPHLMTPYSATNPETTELQLLLQTHFRWDYDQTLLENLWVRAGLEWGDVTRRYPTLFPSQTNDPARSINSAA